MSVKNLAFNQFVMGTRIREAREAAKLTQTALAQACGYETKATVHQWEKGETMPSARSIAILARRAGYSADYILGLTNHPRERFSGDPLLLLGQAIDQARTR